MQCIVYYTRCNQNTEPLLHLIRSYVSRDSDQDLLLVLGLILVNLEVSQRVRVFGSSDDSEEVLEGVLLEVLLGQVLLLDVS